MAHRLDGLSRGFRARYLKFADLEAQMQAWASAYPELVRLQSIGRSLEGRDLWLLTIGPEPDRRRPSVWVDGNMHASELCGSSVALAIAEDVLRLHLKPESSTLPPHVASRLREVLFHVLPRMSPDGAEAVLTEGRYVRSNPRDRRSNRQHARWISHDVNHDGLALVMRKEDPTGEFVGSTEFPGLLLPRRLEDPGPFYKVYPEGHIEHFDGRTVPSPHFLSDNDTDLNRNFPYAWAPEPRQVGAGAFATSEPESRAVVEFTSARPEIFAWLNLHSFAGVFIRPLGDEPDRKMHHEDLEIYRQVAAWGESLTGYPTVSGYEEFLYEPEKPLRGDLTDYAYRQRGALAYVCELWDLFARLGIERKRPFVDHYGQFRREDYVALARWDEANNAGRLIRPWAPFEHPQLGRVEVGGFDPRVGLWNPPYDLLGEVCANQSAAFLRVAAMAPAVRVARCDVTALGADLHRVTLTVRNEGYLGTFGLPSSRELPWNEPLHLTADAEGCALVHDAERHRALGHLDGWGHGLYGDASLFNLRSRGSTATQVVDTLVRGDGRVTFSVTSCRVGTVTHTVDVGSPRGE